MHFKGTLHQLNYWCLDEWDSSPKMYSHHLLTNGQVNRHQNWLVTNILQNIFVFCRRNNDMSVSKR